MIVHNYLALHLVVNINGLLVHFFFLIYAYTTILRLSYCYERQRNDFFLQFDTQSWSRPVFLLNTMNILLIILKNTIYIVFTDELINKIVRVFRQLSMIKGYAYSFRKDLPRVKKIHLKYYFRQISRGVSSTLLY